MTGVRISRASLVLLVAGVLSAYAPGLFHKAFDEKVDRPFILYSAPAGAFLYRLSDNYGRVVYRDEEGRGFDRITFEKKLPFFYYRDLEKWGELPGEVCGTPVDIETIRRSLQFVRITPDDIHTPRIDLYPLFESKPIFANLEYPKEVFRITARMEFVDAATNRINEDLSRTFTLALSKAGFVFPARLISGNPTTRKPFDEGYFVEDGRGELFHVKMKEGKPLIEDTGIRPESGIRFVSVKESSRREFYGVLIDGAGGIHLISYDDYRLIPLPVKGYDPDNMSFQMICDPLNRSFVYQDREGDVIHCVVTGLDYQVRRTFDYRLPSRRDSFTAEAADFLFPVFLETWSPKTDYVLLDVLYSGPVGLAGAALALLLLALARFFQGIPWRAAWTDWILTALFGPLGLVAVLIVGREPEGPLTGRGERS